MSTTLTPIDVPWARRDEADLPALSPQEALRYSRHLLLNEVGHGGQRRLKASRVLLVGAGGLGSPTALYLAAAGIGTLGLVDFDVVDLTNLQRQVLHGTRDVGRPKLASAIDRLRDINPHVTVEPFELRLTAANALDIVREYDLIIDGTDNFPTRYLVNDACVLTGRPNVYGSIFRFEGQASVLATSDGPCYRCLFREPPPAGLVPSCAEGGVLGVLPGLVGTIQATEAIKLLLGVGRPLIGRLLLVDALALEFRTVKVRRDPRCPLCGTREITSLVDYEDFCGLGPTSGHDTRVPAVPEISPLELVRKRDRGDDFDLIDVREPHEYETMRIAGGRLIPLGQLAGTIPTLRPEREVIVYCKAGGRSADAARTLLAAGFQNVWSLAGGITRWSAEVDPALPPKEGC